MSYPIKYAIEELKVTGGSAVCYEDITKGYIVSKCYVLEERIDCSSGNRKYVISFPYDDFEHFMEWFKSNKDKYNHYLADLYKRYYEQRINPDRECCREGYPRHIVSELYDTYEEAKEIADRKNNLLKSEETLNTGNAAYQKLSQEFADTMEICGEYEKFIFANTADMEVSKEVKGPLISDELKSMLSGLIDLYELEYRQLKQHVDYIINHNIQNIEFIEQILERLLNIPYEPCYKLFTRLCGYVSKFNQPFADDYLTIWNDLYGEEEPKIKKKQNK